MYLKRLELVGFKSFANKTTLEFEPGMTAIVGPNGCGKSNVSDAVRWVLGEQSAKALRGGKMQDVIFNGTDAQKALSMAEVSLTLDDCEETLGTEYNQVTVTRRVLRSGEGQYFINKTPCRLKDIQRLFMDTGVGTNSYSIMEQGKIDQILSSRPEDRRAVFEEASGITKYKADKKEALRKLEHTEANLLRLEDIIREVKRQIISLQRQAGKARRYKTIQDKLKAWDLFATRRRVRDLRKAIEALENKHSAVAAREEEVRKELTRLEDLSSATRGELSEMEEQLSKAMDAVVEAQAERDRTEQAIRVNRDRIEELKSLAERDSKDAEAAETRLAEYRTRLDGMQERLTETAAHRDARQAELDEILAQLADIEEQVESTRSSLQGLRSESVEQERRQTRLQNELSDIDAKERSAQVRRERLAAEQSELQRTLEQRRERLGRMAEELETLRAETARREQARTELSGKQSEFAGRMAELEKELGDMDKDLSGKRAQLDLLNAHAAEGEGFSAGARFVLDSDQAPDLDRGAIRGALADLVRTSPEYGPVLQAALGSLIDAVVLADPDAAQRWMQQLRDRKAGSARILSATGFDGPDAPAEAAGTPLIDHLHVDDRAGETAVRLLRGVRVFDRLEDMPRHCPPGALYVSRDGGVIRPNGAMEFFDPDSQDTNPVARRQRMDALTREIAHLETTRENTLASLEALRQEKDNAEQAIHNTGTQLDEARRNQALHEGEYQMAEQEVGQARERAEVVEFELNALLEQDDSGGARRDQVHRELDEARQRYQELRDSIHRRTEDLQALEDKRSACHGEVAERRVRLSEARQAADQARAEQRDLQERVHELESLIRTRSDGVQGYQHRIGELEQNITQASEQIPPLEEKINHTNSELETLRRQRAEKGQTLRDADEELRHKRSELDTIQADKGKMDVELAEQRMRLTSQVERVTGEYKISEADLDDAEEPEWDDGVRPDTETLETEIASMRAKLESMGPVNLVAIEEHQELEERFAFLTQQQDDLVKAKQQLLDMIRHINKTTTELFSKTFEAVNENFQQTFKQLFGGGSAKLVLVDEEDVLESGIEIIARPPGKKLQTVSLLSGGERTMTAVALLFALYMVKPSPFCILDELDAALDDANIGRFVSMVTGFLDRSQYIVITHNQKTIEAADTLYGVTMETRGISKLVSVRLREHAEQLAEPAR